MHLSPNSMAFGIQKIGPGGLKIYQNRAPSVSKALQKTILKQYCFRGRLRTSFFSKNNDFWPVFGLQNGTKIQIKCLKIDVEKQRVFGDDFLSKFLHFGLQKWTPNQRFCIPLSKTPILQKSLFLLGEIAIFQVRRLKKTNKNRCKSALQKNLEKKGSKIEFWHPFWSPKTSKIAPQSNTKPSLFRDAMQTTRNSSEINGRHSFWIAKMARHMIRSSQSINQSIDLPLVALIIKVSPATCNASCIFLQIWWLSGSKK